MVFFLIAHRFLLYPRTEAPLGGPQNGSAVLAGETITRGVGNIVQPRAEAFPVGGSEGLSLGALDWAEAVAPGRPSLLLSRARSSGRMAANERAIREAHTR